MYSVHYVIRQSIDCGSFTDHFFTAPSEHPTEVLIETEILYRYCLGT